VVRQVQASGTTTLRVVAEALNERGTSIGVANGVP
jgi:hypothetical protein